MAFRKSKSRVAPSLRLWCSKSCSLLLNFFILYFWKRSRVDKLSDTRRTIFKEVLSPNFSKKKFLKRNTTGTLVRLKDLPFERYFSPSFVMGTGNALKSRLSSLSHHDTPNLFFLINLLTNDNLFRSIVAVLFKKVNGSCVANRDKKLISFTWVID